MALTEYVVWEVLPASGSDSACAGGFDPSQTAGMNTDGAATSATGSAPVFSSASYNFVAGDVGAFVYIAAGTNWIAGWYQIASVASNAATLNATSGQFTLANNTLSTAGGCASTASPTGATWTIDYSQQASAQFSYTDLVIGATTTNLTSAGSPFGKQQVGNLIQVTSGSGFTTGWYCIKSVSTVTATMDRSVGTTLSTGGHGYQGGALATLSGTLFKSTGQTSSSGNLVWMTGTLTITAAVTFGPAANSSGSLSITLKGYGTYRGDTGRAVVTCATNSVNGIAMVNAYGYQIIQVNWTCTAGTPGDGMVAPSGGGNSYYVTLQDCVFTGWSIGIFNGDNTTVYNLAMVTLIEVEITSSASYGIKLGCPLLAMGCYIHGNGSHGVILQGGSTPGAIATFINCVSSGNTGHGWYCAASTNGQSGLSLKDCVAYDNTMNGVQADLGSFNGLTTINTIYYDNGGYGIQFSSDSGAPSGNTFLVQRNNAFGANGSGARSSGLAAGIADVTLSANPFNNPSTGDFSLNSTSGGGLACTGAGWQSSII
jgi:hypothetical protein